MDALLGLIIAMLVFVFLIMLISRSAKGIIVLGIAFTAFFVLRFLGVL